MLTLFVIGMTCLMAVQGEPEAEADPQFFYPNAYPLYNNYLYPRHYPTLVRTPLVQKATVVQKTPEVEEVKPAEPVKTAPFFGLTRLAYPTYQPVAYYPPFTGYAPRLIYPTTQLVYPAARYPLLQPVAQPAEQLEETETETEEVIEANTLTRDAMTHQHLRPIVPLFDYVRNANSQVNFLRPDQAPAAPEIQENGENDALVQFRSLPYTQAHLNRIPVAA